MKNRTTILNSALAAVLAGVLLISMLVKTMCPQIILPGYHIPYIVAISLVAMVITSFFKTEQGCYIWEAILAGVSFSILPYVAGVISAAEVLKFAVGGAIIFAILNALYKAMEKRLDLAGATKAAVIPGAFVLYLACQCFSGWIL